LTLPCVVLSPASVPSISVSSGSGPSTFVSVSASGLGLLEGRVVV
jgi:hypothetical protein